MRYLFAVTLLWAFSFSLIGVYLAGQVDAWFSVLIRIALATLVFLPFLKFKQTPYLDPALSLFIAAYILYGVAKRLKETLTIFLQGVPEDMSINEIEEELVQIQNVASIHHTHIWSQEGEHHVFSTHLKLKNIQSLSELLAIKNEVKERLKPYHFDHCTVETELDKESCRIKER